MRLFLVLLAVMILPVSACGGDGGGGTDKKTACDSMKKAITSIGTLQVQEGENSGDFSKIYTNASKKIRTAANDSADAGVKSAGLQLADALDMLTKSLNSGEPSGGPQSLEASGRLATAATTFEKHCGPVG